MKYILLIFIFVVSNIFALTSDEKIEKLTKQMQQIQQELEELKKERAQEAKKRKAEMDKLRDEHQKNSDELYDFAENIETKVLEDKIKVSMGLKFGNDNIEKKFANGNTVSSNNLLSTKFMLNLKADITKDLRFLGRLSMYKYWGSSIVHQYSYFDNMQGRVPSNSALYVERAYVDWFLFQDTKLPIALTIGRQPSSDGPSHQFKENLTRKATYSALLFDGVADGAVLTLNLSKILNYDKTYLRFGYSKGFGYIDTDDYIGNAYVGASNDDIRDTDVYGVFFDTTLFGMPNSLIQVSFSQMKNIIANPLDDDYDNNKNIGDMQLFGAMIELTDVADMGLDLFAHYGYNITDPNGKTYKDPNGNYVGLLGDGKKSKSGYAYWIGGRYSFDSDGHWKFGAEYNHGSQNWVSLTQGGFDVYNKLSTRGDAYEAYLMYVYNRYLNFRLGYINIDYIYGRSGWFVGEAKKITKQDPQTTPNEKSDLDDLGAVYLKMNLNY